MVNKKRRLNKLRSRNHPRPLTRTACEARVKPLGSLAVLPTGVLLRFGEVGRPGNSIRLIRIVIRVRIIIGVRIIPVRIVIGVPIVSTDEDTRTSVEMASNIISTMPTIVPTMPPMPAIMPSVARIISTMPAGSSTTISLCLF